MIIVQPYLQDRLDRVWRLIQQSLEERLQPIDAVRLDEETVRCLEQLASQMELSNERSIANPRNLGDVLFGDPKKKSK